ncbi:MAG TPA: circadian clock KaiB family protein [Syntrophales bacterium]|nr:circadian clock KaiB family protein [Syntrophales bacterium]
MEKKVPVKPVSGMEEALEKRGQEKYLLRLYVAGATPASTAAIRNIKKICDENLRGCYELAVIDIYQQPVLARDEQILAAPTLIKKLPLPIRRFIGDMANKERILVGLDLRPREASPEKRKTTAKHS